jgi:hypothetical protein
MVLTLPLHRHVHARARWRISDPNLDLFQHILSIICPHLAIFTTPRQIPRRRLVFKASIPGAPRTKARARAS